jgi:dTDP-4-dehydrorhamnose reductase
MKILVTGSNGQLGNEIRVLSEQFSEHSYLFTDIAELDICDKTAIEEIIVKNHIQLIINCAAYTAVDRAEQEQQFAFKLNAEAIGNLCEVAQSNDIFLVHISTDYVFDGHKKGPYLETDLPNPFSVYGKTKCKGEEIILQHQLPSIIIRTSWLYSSFGNNFVKTILRLSHEKTHLNVISDQIGAPTYARDLAKVILQIIASGKLPDKPEIYHFANEGRISWFDFAIAILELSNINMPVKPIPALDYPLPAPRPANSLFCLDKIKNHYKITIPFWKDSLKDCLKAIGVINKEIN